MGPALAVADVPHGVLPPGLAHDLGVGRESLGLRRSPRDGLRAWSPHRIRAAIASACRSSPGSRIAPSGMASPPFWSAPRSMGFAREGVRGTTSRPSSVKESVVGDRRRGPPDGRHKSRGIRDMSLAVPGSCQGRTPMRPPSAPARAALNRP
jgi:hypothetical protein